MPDLENDPYNTQPSDEGLAQSKQILGQMGGALAFLPKEFIKGGIEAGKRFVEGGQMVGALPGTPGWVDGPPPAPVADESAGLDTSTTPQAAPGDAQAPQAAPEAAPPVASARRAVSAPARATSGAPDVEAPVDLSSGGQSSDHPIASALAAQGVDPAVAAMLAHQQRMQDELTAAQKKAADRAEWAQIENNMMSGVGVLDKGEGEARLAEANRPVQDVLQRQEAAGKDLEQASKQQDFVAKAEASNPSSAVNVAFRDFYKKAGINLPPGLTLANGGALAEKYQEHLDKERSDKRHLTQEREGKKADFERALMQEQHADYRAGLKAKGDKAEKPLSPAERKDIDDLEAAEEGGNDLRAKQAEVGPVTGALAKIGIPLGAAGRYEDAKKIYAGPIAQAQMPGARAAGPKMVAEALPSGLTPSGRAQADFNSLEKSNLERREAKIRALEAQHGADHPEVAQYRANLERDKAAYRQHTAGAKGGSDRVNGHLNGKPVNVARKDLEEAKRRGFVPSGG